jgi:hypothetical protein
MSIKIQSGEINKKITINSVNNYAEFVEKVRKGFSQLPTTFKIYYLNGE